LNLETGQKTLGLRPLFFYLRPMTLGTGPMVYIVSDQKVPSKLSSVGVLFCVVLIVYIMWYVFAFITQRRSLNCHL
jgi:hypothetical protein